MKGNPIASMRFRWQTYLKSTGDPMESEWASTKEEAIKQACKYLIKNFTKWGKDDINVKVFNEMNHKAAPIEINLIDCKKLN